MTMIETLGDILCSVSWGELGHKYFNKSAKWIYGKINNNTFSPEEKMEFKKALLDLSRRIADVANRIE